MNTLPDSNVEQLLQGLQSSDYATRRNAIEQLGKLPFSNYEIVSALLTALHSAKSVQIVKAIGVCLSASPHQKILEEFAFAASDAASSVYNPSVSASERIIYDYVHKKHSGKIPLDPPAESTPSLVPDASTPEQDIDDGSVAYQAKQDAKNKTYNPPESEQARKEYDLAYYTTRNEIATRDLSKQIQQQRIHDQEAAKRIQQQRIQQRLNQQPMSSKALTSEEPQYYSRPPNVPITEMANLSLSIITHPKVETFDQYKERANSSSAIKYVLVATIVVAIASLIGGPLGIIGLSIPIFFRYYQGLFCDN